MAHLDIVAVFGCDGRRIELARRHIAEDGSLVAYEARLDGQPLATLSTDGWQRPGLLVLDGRLVLWAGARLLVVSISTAETFRCETNEEIVDVGHGDNFWYIVTELGVEARSADLTAVAARYDHGEILLRSHWEGQTVLVTDLEQRNVRLNLPNLTSTD